MGFPVLKLDKPMTVAEFLEWDSGDDRIWELHDGYPILKDGWGPKGHAAPSPRHNAIVGELGRRLGNAIREAGLPCRVEPGSGVYRDSDRSRGFYVPDLLVRCGGRPGEGVVLVAEVLSPSNSAQEIMRKDAVFRSMPGLTDILFLDAERTAARHFGRRGTEEWRLTDLEGDDAVLRLHTPDLAVPLGEIYAVVRPDPGEEG